MNKKDKEKSIILNLSKDDHLNLKLTCVKKQVTMGNYIRELIKDSLSDDNNS